MDKCKFPFQSYKQIELPWSERPSELHFVLENEDGKQNNSKSEHKIGWYWRHPQISPSSEPSQYSINQLLGKIL